MRRLGRCRGTQGWKTNAPSRSRILLVLLDALAWLLIGLFVGACGWEFVGSPRGSIHIGAMIVVAMLSGLGTIWLLRRRRAADASPRTALDWPVNWRVDWPTKLDIAAGVVVAAYAALAAWMLALAVPSLDAHGHPPTIVLVLVGNFPFVLAGAIWLIVRYSRRLYDWLRR